MIITVSELYTKYTKKSHLGRYITVKNCRSINFTNKVNKIVNENFGVFKLRVALEAMFGFLLKPICNSL